ncbi:hypothetical protein I317_04090 [Kwoniella heveanensis CBS 569]|nr:hypothetical protein I317_04090 [Kwoniella heveanensis CBS 569]
MHTHQRHRLKLKTSITEVASAALYYSNPYAPHHAQSQEATHHPDNSDPAGTRRAEHRSRSSSPRTAAHVRDSEEGAGLEILAMAGAALFGALAADALARRHQRGSEPPDAAIGVPAETMSPVTIRTTQSSPASTTLTDATSVLPGDVHTLHSSQAGVESTSDVTIQVTFSTESQADEKRHEELTQGVTREGEDKRSLSDMDKAFQGVR